MNNLIIFQGYICALLESRQILAPVQVQKIKETHRTRGGTGKRAQGRHG